MASPWMSIVIPTYNEEAAIGDVVAAARSWLEASGRSWEIIVVDNASEDGTREVVAPLLEERVLLLENDVNRGKGFSIRRGMLEARGELRLMCDADCTRSLASLDRMVAATAGADVVAGSRVADGADVGREQPIRRRIVGWPFIALTRLTLREPTRDVYCGFKLWRAAAAEAVFARQRVLGWAFDAESLAMARGLGFHVAEVGIEWTDREGSKLSIVHTLVPAVRELVATRKSVRAARLEDPQTAAAPEEQPGPSNARGAVALWRRPAVLVVLGATALYLLARAALLHRFPYFIDEAVYARYADVGAHRLSGLFESFRIGREPFQMWAAIPWIKLGANPLTAMRLESAVCGLATAGVVGLLGRRLGSRFTGVAAFALFLVLPFTWINDGIGLTEPLVTLLMAAALYLEIELAEHPRPWLGIPLGVVFFVAVLTKNNALPAVGLLPFSLLLLDFSRPRRPRLMAWGAAVAIAIVGVVAGVLVLHSSSLYPRYVYIRSLDIAGAVRPLGDVLRHPFHGWGDAWAAYWPGLRGYVTLPILLGAIAGFLVALRTQRRAALLLAAWIVVPLLVALCFVPFPFPRHVMYLAPPLTVLAALALTEAAARLPERVGRTPALAAAAGVLLLILLAPAARRDASALVHPRTTTYPGKDDAQYVTGNAAGTVWPEVAAELERRAPARHVLVGYGLDGLVLPFLLPSARFAPIGNSAPEAGRAEFRVYGGTPQAIGSGGPGSGYAVLRVFRRPRGGAAVTVFSRR